MPDSAGGARAVAITGLGIVTPLGEGVGKNWERLVAGESGIRRITRFPTDQLKTTIAGTVDFVALERPCAQLRNARLAESAAAEAIAQAGIDVSRGFPGRLFVGVCPSETEWDDRFRLACDQREAHGQPLYDMLKTGPVHREMPEVERSLDQGFVASALDRRYHFHGAPITVTTACASGASAIQLGVEAIRRGSCEAAVAVGTDGSTTVESLVRFSLLSALSTANDPPHEASKPFSRRRDGFVMAEGAGALVLEAPEAARRRGADLLGMVIGCGEAADGFHRTRSDPSGEAIVRSMRTALEDAFLPLDQVDLINAHGTSTPENDKMECLGIQMLFGGRADRIPVTSNKSQIGHTLSAAGAVEAVFSVMSLLTGIVPPTLNYREPDPGLPLQVVGNEAREASLRVVLSNSFGFGGQNVSLVLARRP